MNYSIIFTEISFSPETSILLQIIQIIHMTVGIIPESDREGRAVCPSWLQGDKHNVTPTDKNPSDKSHAGDLLTYPPFFREARRLHENQIYLEMVDALSSLPVLLSLIGTKRRRLSFPSSRCSVRCL